MASDRDGLKTRWTAVLLAGSRPGGDPFAQAQGVALKPLIAVGGEAMVRRVVRALLGVGRIAGVRVVTQDIAAIGGALDADARVTVEPSGPTIAATIEALLADPRTHFPLVVTTADHALLTPAMIEQFLDRSAGADLALGAVERRTLMARLPTTKRTWIGFRGGAYSGANLFGFGSREAVRAVALWRAVEQDRKKGWRMLLAFGPALLLGAGLRLRTVDQSLAAIGRKLDLDLRCIVMSDPLAAVDVDKPADLALVEAILSGHA
ncbi:MAG: nucleotidyltransferase family protein [Pseudomonadota bacterium]|jgi:GTP:adenosylcobinamide-phosphate guanylyltransferase|nr:nucleotidyltransferase family protein [Pseudomonadota bacterium]